MRISDWSSDVCSSDLRRLGLPLIIFVVVIGSIYAGIATPTESAALGVLMALVLAAWKRRLTWAMLREACEGTMRTTAMIMLILVAATFLSFVVTAVGIGREVTSLITDSRSEEHTSELQSLMRLSYAVFCLKK